jgi:hypothetical protein
VAHRFSDNLFGVIIFMNNPYDDLPAETRCIDNGLDFVRGAVHGVIGMGTISLRVPTFLHRIRNGETFTDNIEKILPLDEERLVFPIAGAFLGGCIGLISAGLGVFYAGTEACRGNYDPALVFAATNTVSGIYELGRSSSRASLEDSSRS